MAALVRVCGCAWSVWAEALAKWPWLAKDRWVYGCSGVRQGWEGSGRE